MKKNSNELKDYPDADLLFPSKYITCGDLLAAGGPEERPVRLTIARIEPRHKLEKTKERPAENKPVVYFTQTEKGWVLNKTNSKRLARALGRDPRTWIGKDVFLYVDHDVESFGKIVDGIRVDADRTAAGLKAAPASPAAGGRDEEAELAAAAREAERGVFDEPGAAG